jgi:hypothetical protein
MHKLRVTEARLALAWCAELNWRGADEATPLAERPAGADVTQLSIALQTVLMLENVEYQIK